MAKGIFKFLSSYKTTIALLSVYAFVMAVATFVENRYGTPAVRRYFYGNVLFIALQFLLVVNFICVLVRGKFIQRRKWGMVILHLSFVVILAGAFITHCFGREGMVHIREGQAVSQMTVSDAKDPDKVTGVKLPFEIGLKEFRLVRYPGSHAPSSYESDLIIKSNGQTREVEIYMNRVVRQQGYRIYQMSYDEDEKGTILSLNRDPAGMAVTYTGYAMLLVGVLIVVFGKGSRFRTLAGKLKNAAVISALLLLSTGSLSAASVEGIQNHVPPAQHAEQFGRLLVQDRSGRIEPVNTYAGKILRKIHRSGSFEGCSPEQVLLGIMAFPEYWSNVPMIRQKNRELAALLDNDADYISFNELFDASGNYRLYVRVEKIYSKPPNERTTLEKEIVKLDDKANFLYELFDRRGLALYPLPGDPAHKWYSAVDDLSGFTGMDSVFVTKIPEGYIAELRSAATDGIEGADKILGMISSYQRARAGVELPSEKKVSLEILYNKLDLFNRLFKVYLILGAFMLAISLVQLVRPFRGFNAMRNAAATLIVAAFVLHALYFALRWYISGQPPWSNAYESMVYVGWTAVLAGIFFIRRSPITTGLASILGGIVLFVAHLNWMDPEITPLVPVLKSPWLMIHVSVITASYGFLGMSFLLGLFNMTAGAFSRNARKAVRELTVINELSMIIGVCLLALGIFLGAIWANESWGRYWGWDPKETWALITMVVYAIVLHLRLIPKLNSPAVFNTGSVWAFLSVMMTYFGVNYLLGGLHSYGNTDTPSAIWIVGGIYIVIFLLSLYIAWKPNEISE